MPGQQGNIVHAEDLEELEKRLLSSDSTTAAWNRLLRTLLPRLGLELQIPRFSHKSTFNITSTLQRMGLKDLFDAEHADLGGLNGPSKDLYLSDMIQSNTFVTCGENVIGEQHHIEQYPELQKRRSARWVHGWDEPRDYQRAFHDPHDVGEAMHLPLHLRPRQARLPARNAQPARLKFDRPFLFFVRHNPSGMILYVGRYNPRLLP
ncbi:Serpin B12 [Papilio machaon]|uniref:Serpin B12 n=2 Tax=Papilio machaon TaxID=76193 RepID=A0A194RMD5_PAPMA|nr:Serpin B12 [Papilio machaon]